MSQTRGYPLVNQVGQSNLDSFGGTAEFPLLNDVEKDHAKNLVLRDGLITEGIKPLTEFFAELGLGSAGFLGVELVPLVKNKRDGCYSVKRVIPVWIIQNENTSRSSKKRIQFLSSSQFVDWLKARSSSTPRHTLGRSQLGLQSTLSLASGGLPPVREQRIAPAPSVRAQSSRPPAPTTQAPAVQSPPSYVSVLGDVRSSFAGGLEQAESEFRSTPRVAGGGQFDEDEYFVRLDAVNDQRQRLGLRPVEGVTPSTYVR
jgi:hypothetical protein